MASNVRTDVYKDLEIILKEEIVIFFEVTAPVIV
jgi:hypothetical protein